VGSSKAAVATSVRTVLEGRLGVLVVGVKAGRVGRGVGRLVWRGLHGRALMVVGLGIPGASSTLVRGVSGGRIRVLGRVRRGMLEARTAAAVVLIGAASHSGSGYFFLAPGRVGVVTGGEDKRASERRGSSGRGWTLGHRLSVGAGLSCYRRARAAARRDTGGGAAASPLGANEGVRRRRGGAAGGGATAAATAAAAAAAWPLAGG